MSKFLETPLKRYSSGMQLRLAFAVAAHLEPEILVIDEVLAVGDAEFQKKCLGKMDEVSKSGRTVLFVSHNMEAVKRLCTKGVLLVKGECKCIGDIDDVMERYLEQYRPESQQAFYDFPALGPDEFGPKRIEILVDGQPSTIMNMGDKLSFAIDYQSPNPVQNIVVGLLISSDKGEKLINANNVYQPYEGLGIPSKSGRVQCELGQVPLMPGQYAATFWIGPTKQDKRAYEEVINFEVLPHDLWGTGKIPPRNASNFWWNTQFSFQQTTEPSV
ncbi:MAG: Wzt carbohydrate-binding domain-containing protein [Bacteroidota bacterium]